jgi:hypothetical protein
MGRKPEPAKPLLAVKHDFTAALDNAIHHGGMLLQAVEFCLREGVGIPPQVKRELETVAKAYRAAVYDGGDD